MLELGCRSEAIKVYPRHTPATKTFQLLVSPGDLSFGPHVGEIQGLLLEGVITTFWVSHLVKQNALHSPAVVDFCVSISSGCSTAAQQT